MTGNKTYKILSEDFLRFSYINYTFKFIIKKILYVRAEMKNTNEHFSYFHFIHLFRIIIIKLIKMK